MASIRERTGGWQARVTRQGFPSETGTFPTHLAALQWAREIEAQMDRGRYQGHRGADSQSLGQILQRYMDEVSPTKKGAADEAIRIRAIQRRKLAAHSLANLSPAAVARFRDERLREVGAGAVIRDLSLLSSVINHARREWGISVVNPCELMRRPPTPPGRNRLLKPEEEAALLAALQPTGRRSVWMAPLVNLALQTAMRRGELLALRWEHVDLAAQTAFLPVTKNGTARLVPLSTKAVTVLSALGPATAGQVFHISAMTMEAAFRKACGLPAERSAVPRK